MDETYAYARSSNQVDESKSTRLLRFRLMLGKNARTLGSEPQMENQYEDFRQSDSYSFFFFGIDGEPIEFEWNIFPGLTSLELLQKIQKHLQDQNIEPEK